MAGETPALRVYCVAVRVRAGYVSSGSQRIHPNKFQKKWGKRLGYQMAAGKAG
jgi:hypothetical protein